MSSTVLSHGTVLFIKYVVSTVEEKKSVDACDNSNENSLAYELFWGNVVEFLTLASLEVTGLTNQPILFLGVPEILSSLKCLSRKLT